MFNHFLTSIYLPLERSDKIILIDEIPDWNGNNG